MYIVIERKKVSRRQGEKARGTHFDHGSQKKVKRDNGFFVGGGSSSVKEIKNVGAGPGPGLAFGLY